MSCDCQVCEFSKKVQSVINKLDKEDKIIIEELHSRYDDVSFDLEWSKIKIKEIHEFYKTKYPEDYL